MILAVIIIGVIAVIHAVATWVVVWRKSRRARRVRRENQDHPWRTTVRRLPRNDRWALTRATSKGQVITDPRLRELAIQRAQYILTVRKQLERQDAGIGLLRTLFIAGAIEGVLICALGVIGWYAIHDYVFLGVVAVGALLGLYGLVITLIFPPLYRRGDQRLRRLIDLNPG